jgi:hypothetical protein
MVMKDSSVVGFAGFFLSVVGLVFGFISQLQMGDSWRLGFNKNETT